MGDQRFAKLNEQLGDVTVVMQNNIDRTLQNHETLEVLGDKTERLSESASLFHKLGGKLKSTMWWKNCGFTTVIVVVIIVVLIIVIAVAAA